MRSPRIATILVLASCAALAACERERAPTANNAQVATAPAQAVVELQDVVETRPDYIVGISYPKSANGHPALAHALQAYAEAARADLMKAVAGLQGGTAPARAFAAYMRYAVKDRPVFSVQHHPEASPGPTDSLYLFERFAGYMDTARK